MSDVPGGLVLPLIKQQSTDVFIFPDQAFALASNQSSVPATSNAFGYVIRAPRTGTIHSFEFPTYINFDHVEAAYTAGIWTVDTATGLPSSRSVRGSFVRTGTAGPFGADSNGWVVPDPFDTTGSGGGGTKLHVTAGDVIACIIEAPDPAIGLTFTSWRTINRAATTVFPYSTSRTQLGVWSKGISGLHCPIVLKYYDDGGNAVKVATPGCFTHAYEPGMGDSLRFINTGESFDMEFSLPWSVDISGVLFPMNAVEWGQMFVLVSLMSGGNTLRSVTLNSYHQGDPNSIRSSYFRPEWEKLSLVANQTYTLRIEALSSSPGTKLALFPFVFGDERYSVSGGRDVAPGGTNYGKWKSSDYTTLQVQLFIHPIVVAVTPRVLPRLCIPFGLPRAENYTNPGNPSDLLPIVYGDFRVGGLRGPVPSTLIDRPDPTTLISATTGEQTWTYCAAFHQSISVEKVYIDDIEQTFSLSTVAPTANIVVNLRNNFQEAGIITTIMFRPNAANQMLSTEGQPLGQVSWRGRGKPDATGLVLTENCVDQLVDLLTTYGNFDIDDDFDATALAEAIARINTLGYKTAFVVLSTQVTQDWITEMLFNVMGYWRVNGRQQVEFHVDDGVALTLADCNAIVVASRDVIDGDDGVEFVIDRQYLVNSLVAYYLYSYSLGAPSSRIIGENSVTDKVSVNAYGDMNKAVTLRGLRRQIDVETWAAIMLARQSARTRVEGAHVQFTLKEGKFSHLSIGDHIAFTWPYGPTREQSRLYTNEILRIVDLTLDLTRGGGYAVIAQDLGNYLTDDAGIRRPEVVD